MPAADAAARLTTFSNIVVFGTYATYVIMTIMMLVMIIMFMPAAQVSAQRINEVLDTQASLREGDKTQSPEQGTVEFRHVSFHYPNSEKKCPGGHQLPGQTGRDGGLYRRHRQRQDHPGQPGRPVL